MKIEDAVNHMTKSFLHRIIDSFTKDLPKGDEEKSRQIILRNESELVALERIQAVLALTGSFAEQILLRSTLELLIDAPDHSLTEEEIVTGVVAAEKAVLDASAAPDALAYEDAEAVRILREVIVVALEDDEVSFQELRLLERLRERLRISERSKHLILAQEGHFPRAGNRLHTNSELREALTDLQRRGVVFYCNRLDEGRYVVPEELVPSIRTAFGFDLSHTSWKTLLGHLSNIHLTTILSVAGLPKSGKKEEKAERVIIAGIRPSVALEHLGNDDLYEVCRSLPGAKVSGSKQDKIDRIIEYFSSLVTKEVSAEAEPGEVFYEYLIELAHRDRESLLANKVIRKDIDIERAFEEGTRFLITQRLGIELIAMSGSDHPDGCFRLPRSGELLMWDNKSKESVYTFPEAHAKQFKRYIRDALERVSCFMIIVPEIGDGAEESAIRLKVDSGHDTDVALITADDLKWVAENWRSFGKEEQFDPEVFNHTGVLDRRALETRLRLFIR